MNNFFGAVALRYSRVPLKLTQTTFSCFLFFFFVLFVIVTVEKWKTITDTFKQANSRKYCNKVSPANILDVLFSLKTSIKLEGLFITV